MARSSSCQSSSFRSPGHKRIRNPCHHVLDLWLISNSLCFSHLDETALKRLSLCCCGNNSKTCANEENDPDFGNTMPVFEILRRRRLKVERVAASYAISTVSTLV